MITTIISNKTKSTMLNVKSLGDLLPKPFAGPVKVSTTYSYALLEQISSNDSSLRSIHLNSKSLTDANIKSLCEALIRNRSVEELHLCNNKATDVSARHIGHMLKFNKTLRKVYLNGNNIGPKGAAALASALAANTSIVVLSLKGNHIGVEGAGAFAASLCHNRSLVSLNITDNDIPRDHSITDVIYKMLRSNEQYPENKSLVIGLGEELNTLISNMTTECAEEVVLQAEEALRTAMICRRRGDVVGAAEAEGIFIRICTKGQAPLDPPEEAGVDDTDEISLDPPEENATNEEHEDMPKLRMYSRKQSEPDRLDELNDELKTLTYNDKQDDQGEIAFEQLSGEEALVKMDSLGDMPGRFLDNVKMQEIMGDSFDADLSDQETNDVSAEWIGDIHAAN